LNRQSPPQLQYKVVQEAPSTKEIKELSWDSAQADPNNGRLVVALAKEPHLVLYSTILQPALCVQEIGVIKGPYSPDSQNNPKYFAGHILPFQPHFARGSLLPVYWDNGKLALYPLYYRAIDNRQ